MRPFHFWVDHNTKNFTSWFSMVDHVQKYFHVLKNFPIYFNEKYWYFFGTVWLLGFEELKIQFNQYLYAILDELYVYKFLYIFSTKKMKFSIFIKKDNRVPWSSWVVICFEFPAANMHL
jgi:hypothetical protein